MGGENLWLISSLKCVTLSIISTAENTRIRHLNLLAYTRVLTDHKHETQAWKSPSTSVHLLHKDV